MHFPKPALRSGCGRRGPIALLCFITLQRKKTTKTRLELHCDGRLPYPTIVAGCDLAGQVERPTLANAEETMLELQELFQDKLPVVTLPGGVTSPTLSPVSSSSHGSLFLSSRTNRSRPAASLRAVV